MSKREHLVFYIMNASFDYSQEARAVGGKTWYTVTPPRA